MISSHVQHDCFHEDKHEIYAPQSLLGLNPRTHSGAVPLVVEGLKIHQNNPEAMNHQRLD